MEKNVKTSIIFGLVLLFGGVFAFIYFRNGAELQFSYLGIIGTVIGLASVIAVAKIRKTKQEPTQSNETLPTEERYNLPTMNTSRHKTFYWCGNPLEKNNEYCAECGNKVKSCSVCKLPISHGEVGKCKYCETQGHLVHLQE